MKEKKHRQWKDVTLKSIKYDVQKVHAIPPNA